jgi:rhodanese-related sulfurtransferase
LKNTVKWAVVWDDVFIMSLPLSNAGGQPSQVRAVAPLEAQALVAAGTAVLVDVREADEWAETGVAEPAATLAMSGLRQPSEEWVRFLQQNTDRELLLYCHSGGRSQRVAVALASYGYKTANVGGIGDWAGAGLPLRAV